jgi:hypothetical protein
MIRFESDLIFPPRSISSLGNERGVLWWKLIASVEKEDPGSPDRLAFILFLARLNNCSSCRLDSHRATNGCMVCAKQSLRRFHGPDDELALLFKNAKAEVIGFLNEGHKSFNPKDQRR